MAASPRTVILCKISSGLTIVGTPPPLTLSVAYTTTLTAKGGTGKYTFIETGAFPTGVTGTDNGDGTYTIAGTPSVSGTFPISLYVRNANGWATTVNYILQVPPLQVQLFQTVKLYRNIAVTGLTLGASGGKGPYTYIIVSGAPGGVTVSSAGVFSGTPTTIQTAVCTVRVTDAAANTADQIINIVINSKLVLTSANLFSGTPPTPKMEQNTTYNHQMTVSGATGALTWTRTGGGPIPTGINFTSAGLITGAATTIGAGFGGWNWSVTDAGTGDTLTGALSFQTAAMLSSTSPQSTGQKFVLGIPGTFAPTHGNSYGPYTLQTVGGLNSDLTLANGIITINGQSAGVNKSQSLQWVDVLGQTSSFTFNWTVIDPNGLIAQQLNGVGVGTSGPVTYNYVGPFGLTNTGLGGLKTLTLNLATSIADGYLSQTDWAIFNGKQSTISFGAVGSSPNANAASIAAGVITIQPADGSNPGAVTTGTQAFGGNKTFNGNVAIGSGSAAPLCKFECIGFGRFTSAVISVPASGKGLEIYYDSASDNAGILAFDRTGSVYKNLSLRALGFTFDVNGTSGITATLAIAGIAMLTAHIVKVTSNLGVTGANYAGQGFYTGWNISGGNGEINIINHHGGGGGGLDFYETNGSGTAVKTMGWDGKGQLFGANYGAAVNDLGVKTTTAAVDWTISHQCVFQQTNATALTVTFTNPAKACMVNLRIMGSAAGAGGALTLPPTKGTAMTGTGVTTAKLSDYLLWWDGTNYWVVMQQINQ